YVAGPGKDVQVFGRLVDACLMNEGEGAANQERDLGSVENLHGVAIKQSGGGLDQRVRQCEAHTELRSGVAYHTLPRATRVWRGSPRPVPGSAELMRHDQSRLDRSHRRHR